MKRLNRYCSPCCPLPLWVGCVIIAVANIWSCEYVIFRDVEKINKNDGLDKWNEKVELSWFILLAIIYNSLFYGACRGIRKYLVPSLFAFVAVILHLIFVTITELDSYIPVDQSSAKHTFLILGSAVVIFGLFVYSWIVVWSHYLELGEIQQGSHDKVDKVYAPKSLLFNNNVIKV